MGGEADAKGSGDALADIVNATAGEDEVLTTALEIARPLAGKPAHTLGTIKARMYATTLDALRDTTL